MPHRVFIVEDHPVMREGYASLIEAEPDLTVCGQADSAEAAFEQAEPGSYDIAIVDLSLPGVNGVELIKRLTARDPSARILVVSAYDEALYAERVVRAGGRGYLMKHESAKRFVEAVRTVLDGRLYVSESLQATILNKELGARGASTSALAALTDRELEVFESFGHGRTTREVAEALGLSLKTIESHRANIKRKLGLEKAAEFMQRAVLWVESPLSD